MAALKNFHVAIFSAQAYVLDFLEKPLEDAIGGEHIRVRTRLAGGLAGRRTIPAVPAHAQSVLSQRAPSKGCTPE